jgi:hypothetical protein
VRARERARRLVRQIEAAIEAGEFVPDICGYLSLAGDGATPCGCAVGAAAFVGGAEPDACKRPGSVFTLIARMGVMSEYEAEALEAGYEGHDGFDWDTTFFAAGRELRKFHPDVQP